jgi:hypothetical protein
MIVPELHKIDAPDAQVERAASHRGEGANRKRYCHLRPDYPKNVVEDVNTFWSDVGKYTTAHLRSQKSRRRQGTGRTEIKI